MPSDPEAPPPSNEEVVEVSRPRANGWACPWHPLQIVGWLFIAFFAIAHFGFLVFYVPGYWRIPTYIIPGLVLLTHIVCNLVATSLNPAEPGVRHKGQRSRPKFNPSEHKHVIENRYCNLCDANVSDSAKHCRICDKCVTDFDHHCKWLNTCIGQRNYRWFLATIFSALLGAILLLLYSSSLFVVYLVDRDLLRYDCPHPTNLSACDPDFRVFGAVMPHQVFPTLCAVIAVLCAVAVILDGHLCGLHIYLMSKGLSTYDYIVLQREKEEAKQRSSQDGQDHRRKSWFSRWSGKNRVTPSTTQDNGGPSSLEKERSLSPAQRRESSASERSRGSAGMATFGRTPSVSVCSLDSTNQDHANWMLPDDHMARLSTDTVIELDALLHGSLTDPVVVTSPNNPPTENDSPLLTSDLVLPKHMQPSPPPKRHVTMVTMEGPHSDADLGSGSTLSFMVGDDSLCESKSVNDLCHDSSILSAMVVSNSVSCEEVTKEEKRNTVQSVHEISDKTSGGFNNKQAGTSERKPHPLSSRPLPPIGGSHPPESSNLQSQSLKLDTLPALKTGSTFSLPDPRLIVRTLPKLTTPVSASAVRRTSSIPNAQSPVQDTVITLD